VSLDDFTILAANFGFVSAGDVPLPNGSFVARGAAVPEPGAMALLAIGVGGLLSRRRN